jgi:hypothetical protein
MLPPLRNYFVGIHHIGYFKVSERYCIFQQAFGTGLALDFEISASILEQI